MELLSILENYFLSKPFWLGVILGGVVAYFVLKKLFKYAEREHAKNTIFKKSHFDCPFLPREIDELGDIISSNRICYEYTFYDMWWSDCPHRLPNGHCAIKDDLCLIDSNFINKNAKHKQHKKATHKPIKK